MFPRVPHRARHYVLLISTWALLCLPNLGGPSLWDIDEGNNATAGYEMRESGNWIVPTFNNQLRKDKPALLYWLQAAAYGAFGVNEFSARLPSALAALAAVLTTYELGRLLAGKGVGLLAGLILASAVGFDAAAHFANPDALLNASTVLTLLLFWYHFSRGGSRWFVLTGLTTGLGMLAKGPVGVVLPVAVTLLFLFWKRQLRLLGDLRLLGAALVFVAVAAPWYVWVALETKGEWLFGFLREHNIHRFRDTMENHGGSLVYYPLVLIAGFAPWSVFLAAAGWYAVRRARIEDRGPRTEAGEERSAGRGLGDGILFLAAWVAVYGLFFTAARTKLPNYILPLYPAVAILTAIFLDHWRRGIVRPPAWMVPVSLSCLALMGVGIALGLLLAAGVIEVSVLRGRQLPGLAAWAGLGVVLVLGAGVASWCTRRGRPAGVIRVLAVTAVVFAGTLGAWGAAAVERHKAPRSLARCLPADQTRREVRLASYFYKAVPVLTSHIYRQANLTNQSKYVLLPGEATMYNGSDFVGRMNLPLVAIGEQFTAGFGAEPQLQVNRQMTDKSRTMQGGNQVLRYEYRILINSYKPERVKLQVWDRLPHAENETVGVSLVKATPDVSKDPMYQREDRPNNLLRWDLDIDPDRNGEKASMIQYEFKLELDKQMTIGSFQSR